MDGEDGRSGPLLRPGPMPGRQAIAPGPAVSISRASVYLCSPGLGSLSASRTSLLLARLSVLGKEVEHQREDDSVGSWIVNRWPGYRRNFSEPLSGCSAHRPAPATGSAGSAARPRRGRGGGVYFVRRPRDRPADRYRPGGSREDRPCPTTSSIVSGARRK